MIISPPKVIATATATVLMWWTTATQKQKQQQIQKKETVMAIAATMIQNGNDHTNEGQGNSENVANNGNEGEGGFGDTQRNREGVHDNEQQTSSEGANQGGQVCDSTIPAGETGGDGCVSANCFGKVISREAQEHKDPESGEERLGEHARDPLSGDADNETPRQGIGNQDQGHPAAHGAFNSQFDDDDAENVEENC